MLSLLYGTFMGIFIIFLIFANCNYIDVIMITMWCIKAVQQALNHVINPKLFPAIM